MRFEGRPRSIAEMEFVAAMYRCEKCTDRRPLGLETGGSGEVWVVTATCPRCRSERRFTFVTDEDLFAVEQPALELGHAEPSRILRPYELLGEVDRLAPVIVTDPARLEDPAWSANSDAVERVLTALHELAKFLAPGQDAMTPDVDRSPEGVADHRARPERYTRSWIEQECVRWEAVANRIAADAARVFAADPVLSRGAAARGAILPETVAAHRAWLDRGRTGAGRLDVVTWDGDELHLARARLIECRLEGVRLQRAELRSARFDDAELVDVDLTEARLEESSFRNATLRACTFVAAQAVGVSFERAQITAGACAKARLDQSSWASAEIENTSFKDACLARASFVGARVTGCDFRGAELAGCDFSGAVLIRCAFAGAYGAPGAIAGWRVIDADLSAAADGRSPGTDEDLLAELRS